MRVDANNVGTFTLDAIAPDMLFVASAEGLIGPPGLPGPTDLNDYKCYTARVSVGAPPFPSGTQVTVADEFRTQAATFDLKKPQ